MSRRCCEISVKAGLRGGLAAVGELEKLAATPAHGNDRYGRHCTCIDSAGHEVAPGIALSFDQENVGARSHGVGPFDVQGDFPSPAGVWDRQRAASSLIDDFEAWRRCDSKLGIEC